MISRKLSALFRIIAEEAESNPAFAARLETALFDGSPSRPRGKRAPAVLDPVSLLDSVGEQGLREHLRPLTLDQLKDIVSEHGMDKSHLVLKWTKSERIIDHIVGTASARARKGDAFR